MSKMDSKEKKAFINVFKEDYVNTTPKLTKLFRIEKVRETIREGISVSIIVRLTTNRPYVVRRMLNEADYHALLGGIPVTGISKCHKDDTWDEQKGLDIAEHYALRKCYHIIAKMCSNRQKTIIKELSSLNDISQKFNEKANKQYKCIKNLGGK